MPNFNRVNVFLNCMMSRIHYIFSSIAINIQHNMNKKWFKYLSLLFVGLLCYACKQQPMVVSKIDTKQYKVDTTLVGNKAIDSFIAPYRNHLNKTLDSTLCVAVMDMTKNDGQLESTLGNLMADISLKQAQPIFKKRYHKEIDFVLFNNGGMRSPIIKGEVTARSAFQVMPFENELVVVELAHDKVKELLEYLTTQQKAHPISNLQLSFIKKTKEIKKTMINGEPFKKDKTYFVLTTDYLQQGGDSMNFFKEPIQLYKTDYKLRNAMIDYFKSVDTLDVQLDNRMNYAE